MSSFLRYQIFETVSGNLGGQATVADDDVSSHEQETYPTTSLVENFILNLKWIETFTLIWDRFPWLQNLKWLDVVVVKLTIQKFLKRAQKWTKWGCGRSYGRWRNGERCSISSGYSSKQNYTFSFFPMLRSTPTTSNKYKSNGLYAHKSFISNNFRPFSLNTRELHCERYG